MQLWRNSSSVTAPKNLVIKPNGFSEYTTLYGIPILLSLSFHSVTSVGVGKLIHCNEHLSSWIAYLPRYVQASAVLLQLKSFAPPSIYCRTRWLYVTEGNSMVTHFFSWPLERLREWSPLGLVAMGFPRYSFRNPGYSKASGETLKRAIDHLQAST